MAQGTKGNVKLLVQFLREKHGRVKNPEDIEAKELSKSQRP